MPIFKNRDPQYVEHVQGGDGRMLRDRLLTDEQLGGACSLVAHLTLEPGSSIGVHQHVGDTELYFITSGAGTYTDNGEEYPVEKGDVLFCEDGATHGIANTGAEDLTFVAVIQKNA